MKLSKALKEKKKLIAEADKYYRRFASSNSHQEGKDPSYDAKENFKLWKDTTDKLIALKAKIQIANQPILYKIYKLAELKNAITKMRSIDCTSGLHEKSGGFGVAAVDVQYVAFLSEVERDEYVDEFEAEIEEIQSELEEFNAVTNL